MEDAKPAGGDESGGENDDNTGNRMLLPDTDVDKSASEGSGTEDESAQDVVPSVHLSSNHKAKFRYILQHLDIG